MLATVYFLLNHGKGYTREGLYQMYVDEVTWHARKLKDEMDERNKAYAAQAAKVKNQQLNAAARSRAGRR